jgi:ABC-type transport system involved in multi-copper enzyme maturation permease subunit
MMIVFGATLVGSEYGFDTWKNLLTRRPGRAAFILSKWIVLVLALLIATVVLPIWAQALGFLFAGVLPPAAATDLPLVLYSIPGRCGIEIALKCWMRGPSPPTST